jgi:hypothetical protein
VVWKTRWRVEQHRYSPLAGETFLFLDEAGMG